MNTQFKKGVLSYCVLLILRDNDCYGYELVSKCSAYIDISEGTIYPLLKRLRQDKYVDTYLQESRDGPPRKYYQISKLGIKHLNKLRHEWQFLKDGIDNLEQLYGGKYE